MTQKKTYSRTAPFTQQNWQAGHIAKSMGASFSTLKSQDDGGPPQKRQKTSTSDPVKHVSPLDPEKRSTLRIDVHKLFHKDSKKTRSLQAPPPTEGVLNTKGKCQITVSDVSKGFTHILYRSSQACDILTHKNPAGPHRISYIKLPKPFLIPEETILVNRQDDEAHDFSTSYKLDVDFESIHDGTWPPLDANELGFSADQQSLLPETNKQKWVLHSEFAQVYARSKNPVKLTTGFHPQRPERSTDYVMDVDLRWATNLRTIDNTAKNCITAFDPDAAFYTNGQLEPIFDDLLESTSPSGSENGVDGFEAMSDLNEVNGINGIDEIGGINGIDEIDEIGGINGIDDHGMVGVKDINGTKEDHNMVGVNDTKEIDQDQDMASINGVNGTDDDKDHGIADADGINGIDNDHYMAGINDIEGIDDDKDHDMADANGINDVAHDANGVNGIQEANGVNERVGEEDSLHDHSHDHSHELEEELEGDQTPNRALRKRTNNKQYNLKVLTAQAHGKERKPRVRSGHLAQVEGRVTYLPPINEPVYLDSWRCLTCGCLNDSLALLRAHLKEYHANYDYALETTSQGPLFRVTRISGSVGSPTQTLQLGKPTKSFDLQDYVDGENSWTTSRFGPDHIEEPVKCPSKPSTARQLFDNPVKKPSQPTPAAKPVALRPKKKSVIIPDSIQPLFDPISKARLKPGEELPKSVVDSSWLIQKHREDIGEFSDVSAEEKEYIRRWDAFILQESVTAGAYLRRAWLKFVKENALWLVSASHRMNEYSKHLCVLMVRDILDDQSIENAGKLIDEARAELKSGGGNEQTSSTESGDASLKQSPRASQIVKGTNGCTVCQLPVLGPSLLVCSNKVMHALFVCRTVS
ncbi:hypothetical protein QYS62_009239 [Fusarium acuminatum]|uniref:Polycomb protein VEFS-Box domain-containing protein n=1 Tax=Fusarium acuminatum TaxID=5515 RepID=A0ABZ2X6J8_9HYPO